jgi:hypothetical protein
MPEAPPAGGSAASKTCAVASAISAALLADEDAMAEIAALPAQFRSDADAVMLWNGAWLGSAPDGQPPALQENNMPEVKRVVTTTVMKLPAACIEAQTAGPQFVPVAESGRTTMVVIGSGLWRWSNLLDPPTNAPAALAATRSAANRSPFSWFLPGPAETGLR